MSFRELFKNVHVILHFFRIILYFPIYVILSLINKIHRWFKIDRYYAISLIIVVLVGAFLRLWNLGKLGFTTDEIYIGLSMKLIREIGAPILPDGTYYMRGIVQSLISAFFSYIFGINEFSARLPSALAGIISIFLIYSIGKNFFNKQTGLFASIIFCFSPWTVEFARWGRMYSLFSLCLLATFYFSYIGFNQRKIILIIFGFVFTILCLFVDNWGYIALPVFIFAGIINNFNYKTIEKYFKIKYFSIVLLIFFSFILSNYIKNIIIRKSIYISPIDYIIKFFSMFKFDNFDSYFLLFYIKEYPTYYVFFVFLICILLVKNIFSREALYAIITFICSLLFVCIFHLHLVARYIYFTYPLLILLLSYSFYLFIFKFCGRNYLKQLIFFLIILFILIPSLNLSYTLKIPFRNYNDKYLRDIFAPSFVNLNYSNTKTNFIYLKENDILNNNSIVIADNYQFYYYYTGKQPDYFIRPGKVYFTSDDDKSDGVIIRYMSKTILLYIEQDFIRVVKEGIKSKKNIYLAVNLESGHSSISDSIKLWIENLKNYGITYCYEYISKDGSAVVIRFK